MPISTANKKLSTRGCLRAPDARAAWRTKTRKSVAEGCGNRTHREPEGPADGFEDRETHQDPCPSLSLHPTTSRCEQLLEVSSFLGFGHRIGASLHRRALHRVRS